MRAETQGKITVLRAARWGLRQLRLGVNTIITLTVPTHKAWWRKVARQEPTWDERNRIIASFIPGNSSVIDLGSGARTLQRHLKPGCDYQPCDVVRSAPEVLLCDFNAGLYPAVCKTYDYVVCSGVLEYVRNPVEFLSRIAGLGEKIILSYNPVFAGESKLSRLGKYWVNHFAKEELENMIQTAGFTRKVLFTRPPNEITYELEKPATGNHAAAGLKARHVIARAAASPASEGPG